MGIRDLYRHRKRNIKWEVKDATKDNYPMTDYILIDAPCTGTGVLGRKPDIKWRRKNEDIQEMAKKQLDILSHCSKFIKANGVVVPRPRFPLESITILVVPAVSSLNANVLETLENIE